MQINTIGFPAGILGALGAAPTDGAGFAQTLGMALGAPANTAGPAPTPPAAANDSVAQATPLTMAQLLTTAAPLAPATDAAPETLVTTQATPAAQSAAAPLPAETPVDASAEAMLTEALPQDPAAALAAKPDQPAAPAGNAKAAPAAKTAADPLAEMLAEPAAEAPAPEVATEQPTEGAKDSAPAKRGPRLATTGEEVQPADPATIPADAQTVDMVAVAVVQQVPVKPELAVKPQASPTRQMGDVAPAARKADAGRAEPATTADPAARGARADAAVSAIAGKQGEKNDNAASDDRGQAPAFTLRHDAHVAPAHAAAEPARSAATTAPAAAEPVVAARPGHLGQQMGVEIARKVEAGEDTLRVRLSPDNLGKVEVTLAFDDGGTLRATVRAESQHALDLLRQDAPDLGRALDQAGIRADAQSFRFESRSEGGTAQGQQQQSQNHNGGPFAGNDEPDTTEAAYREIRGDGQVDLLA